MSAPRSDADIPYTTFRIALASGLLGGVGATIAWLGWLTVRVWSADLLLTVVIGGALGAAVHWFRHYIRVARLEHAGERPDDSRRHAVPSRPARAALYWAGGFGFLGLVTEHLAAHMTAEFLVPFLASLASLLPAGIIFGWSMSRGRAGDDNVVQLIATGMFTGAAVAVVTGVIWLLGFGSAPWFALLAWWGMLGIGMRFATPAGVNAVKPLAPAFAVGGVFVAIHLLDLLPATTASYAKFGAPGNFVMSVRVLAAGIDQSPALPATFWLAAEERFERRRGTPGAAPAAAPAIVPAAADTGQPPQAAVNLKHAVDDLTGADSARPVVPDAAARARARGVLIRSWLVILLFAVGIGVAPAAERALRPADYPNSETFRRDVALAVVVAVALAGACLAARLSGGGG